MKAKQVLATAFALMVATIAAEFIMNKTPVKKIVG